MREREKERDYNGILQTNPYTVRLAKFVTARGDKLVCTNQERGRKFDAAKISSLDMNFFLFSRGLSTATRHTRQACGRLRGERRFRHIGSSADVRAAE